MIKFPFIQHTSVGIHISHATIYWVEARRLADTVKIISLDQEPIDDSLGQAIQNLASRHDLSYPFVSVNIPLADITYRLVNAPEIEDETIFESWLENQYSDLMPDESHWERYLIQHHLLVLGEDSAKGFFAMVAKDTVNTLQRSFESAGLYPIHIGTGILEMAYGLILSKDFVAGTSHLLKEFENESFFATYQNGVLDELTYLDPDDNSFPPAIAGNITEEKSILQKQDSKPPSVYRVSAGQPENDLLQTESEHDRAQNFKSIPANDATSFKGEFIPNSHMVALGLSVKQLYPDLDEINFTDPDAAAQYQRQTEKKDVVHLSIGLAAVFIGILVLALSFKLFTDFRLSSVETIAGNMAGQISAVEAAADDLQSERVQATQIQELIQDRHYFAPVLDLIGRTAPENIWLSTLSAADDSKGLLVGISGYSATEIEISRFMERLEQADQVGPVLLQHSQRGSADDFLDDFEGNERQLFQFDINLRHLTNTNP